MNISVLFNLGVHDDYVTILLLEVSRNDDNGALLQKILKFALLNLNLKIFSILICAPGSLQRLLPGKNVETLLHTSYWGFSSDVIYSAVPPTSISKNENSINFFRNFNSFYVDRNRINKLLLNLEQAGMINDLK